MWTIYKLWKINEHTILKLWTLIKNIIESTHKFPYNILFTFLMDRGRAPNGIGHLMILSLISWCAVLTNTPGLRDSVVMRVLSDFYWTAATGAGLFTSNSATQQRHAEHCVQAARALCWERVSLTGIPVGNQSDQGNIPDAVTWACVVRMCIQWKHVLCC